MFVSLQFVVPFSARLWICGWSQLWRAKDGPKLSRRALKSWDLGGCTLTAMDTEAIIGWFQDALRLSNVSAKCSESNFRKGRGWGNGYWSALSGFRYESNVPATKFLPRLQSGWKTSLAGRCRNLAQFLKKSLGTCIFNKFPGYCELVQIVLSWTKDLDAEALCELDELSEVLV